MRPKIALCRNIAPSLAVMAAAVAWFTVPLAGQWNNFASDAQHAAQSQTQSQHLDTIHWHTPVDLAPQYSQGALLIHYGSPLVTAANTVIVPVKTGASGGFRVEARAASDGSVIWQRTSDYILPGGNFWTPVFGPALTALLRLYYPGAGGTVYYRDAPDSPDSPGMPPDVRVAFFGTYSVNPQAYNASIKINTPLTSDLTGNIYFGFLVSKNNLLWPLHDATGKVLVSGIARIDANGTGTWISVTDAARDPNMTQVVYNCAPAVRGGTVYVAVSNGSAGYLVSLNSSTLAPQARVRLKDPKSGKDALLSNSGSASPTVGPDGDVYFGVLEDPCCKENHDRGWLLHSIAPWHSRKSLGLSDGMRLLPWFQKAQSRLTPAVPLICWPPSTTTMLAKAREATARIRLRFSIPTRPKSIPSQASPP